MKITMNLDDDLHAAIRERAAVEHTTMRGVVEEALRRLLTDAEAASYHLQFPVTQGTRPPAIDVDSNAALDEYLDRAELNKTAT